jgi:hypothetical protein
MRNNPTKTDIDASTIDVRLKDAVDDCLVFLTTTQWVGNEYRMPCDVAGLERGLHPTPGTLAPNPQ